MKKSIGTCSLCGGPVTVPDPWWGIFPPTPACDQCGAVPVAAHGPVLPMKRPMSFVRGAGCVGVTNDPKKS
jgi:hypothetical protein